MANWVASREGSGRTGKESGREGCHAVGNGLAVHGSDALGMRCKAVHRARECVRRVSRAEGARAAGIAARGGPPYFFRVELLVHDTCSRKSVRGRGPGDSTARGRPFAVAHAAPAIGTGTRRPAFGVESSTSTFISHGASVAARQRSQRSRFFEAISNQRFAF